MVVKRVTRKRLVKKVRKTQRGGDPNPNNSFGFGNAKVDREAFGRVLNGSNDSNGSYGSNGKTKENNILYPEILVNFWKEQSRKAQMINRGYDKKSSEERMNFYTEMANKAKSTHTRTTQNYENDYSTKKGISIKELKEHKKAYDGMHREYANFMHYKGQLPQDIPTSLTARVKGMFTKKKNNNSSLEAKKSKERFEAHRQVLINAGYTIPEIFAAKIKV